MLYLFFVSLAALVPKWKELKGNSGDDDELEINKREGRRGKEKTSVRAYMNTCLQNFCNILRKQKIRTRNALPLGLRWLRKVVKWFDGFPIWDCVSYHKLPWNKRNISVTKIYFPVLVFQGRKGLRFLTNKIYAKASDFI